MVNHTLPAILLILSIGLAGAQEEPLWTFRGQMGLQGRLVADSGAIYGSSYDGGIFAVDELSGALLWRGRLPARCGSPAAANDTLVYGCSNRIAYGVNRTTGNRTWVQVFPEEFSTDAVISDGIVYLGTSKGKAYAIQPENGKVLWRADAGAGINAAPEPADGMIYLPTGAGVVALRLIDGSVAWNFTQAGSVMSSPTIYRGEAYFGSDMGILYSVDKSTGELRWESQAGNPIQSKPLVSRSGVFFSTVNGVIWGLNPDGTPKWNYTLGRYASPNPILYRGSIWATDGANGLVAIDPETGALTQNLTYDGWLAGPPLFSSGRTILAYSSGDVRAYGGTSDLRIDSLEYDRRPYRDKAMTVNVTVKNDGGLILDAVNVSLKADGAYLSSKEMRLTPYMSQTASFNVTLTAGRHILEASAPAPEGIGDANSENNQAAAVVDAADYWPILRHDASRSGAPYAIDDFAEPTKQVTWQCILPNNTYPQTTTASFAPQILGETGGFYDARPEFTCYGYSDIYPSIRANLTCRATNVTDYAMEAGDILRRIDNLSSSDAGTPEDFNVTFACDVASNDTLPFDNATLSWNCMRNRWGATEEAKTLWYCNSWFKSSFSMEAYSAVRGVKGAAQSAPVSPKDYGLIWKFDAGYPIYSSPVSADLDGDGSLETVFAASDGTVYALSSSGKPIWKYKDASAIHSTPAIADLGGGYGIYFGDDAGIMHALDAAGNERWQYRAGGPILTSPLPVYFGESHGTGIVFGSDDGTEHFLDADGTELWNYSAQDKIQSSAAAGDIVGNGKTQVAFGSDDNNLHVLSIPPYQHWYQLTNGDVTGTPAVYNSSDRTKVAVTSQDGAFYDAYYILKSYEDAGRKCVGMDCAHGMIPLTGMDSDWAFSSTKPIETSPLVFYPYNNGSAYFAFGSDDGSLYIIDESGRKLVRYSANKDVRSSPSAISLDGKTYDVVFGDDQGRIYVIDMNGTAKWTYLANGSIRSSPAVEDIDGNGIPETLITSLDGSIYAFGYSPGAYNGTRQPTTTTTTTTTATVSTSTTSTSTTTTSSTTSTSATTSSTATSTSTSTTMLQALTSSTTTSTTERTTTTSSTISSSTTSTTGTLPPKATTTTTTASSTTTVPASSTTEAPTTTAATASSTTTEASSTTLSHTSTTVPPMTSSSTTSTLPGACEPEFFSGVSGKPCVAGAALNSAVYIPSVDMDVALVSVPNATGVNVTIMDSLLNKVAYSFRDGALNSTIRLKAGELYIFSISSEGGCASQPPSIRTITSDGTWFVQDMWCSEADSCPMAVKLSPKACIQEPKPPEPQTTLAKAQTVAPAPDGPSSSSLLSYVAILILVFILAVIIGISYNLGKENKRGKSRIIR